MFVTLVGIHCGVFVVDTIKHSAEDHGRKPVVLSTPAKGW